MAVCEHKHGQDEPDCQTENCKDVFESAVTPNQNGVTDPQKDQVVTERVRHVRSHDVDGHQSTRF
jgi:hypothetical protein